MLENCKKIVIIKNTANKGVAVGWNQGIKTALNSGATLMLVTNNDIIFDVECMDILIAKLKQDGGVVSANHNEKTEGLDHQTFWSCYCLDKATVDKVGFFDEHFYPARVEDRDYHERCDVLGINRFRLFNAKVWHENNGTGKFLKENDPWKSRDWAGDMGNNMTYFQKKWGHP